MYVLLPIPLGDENYPESFNRRLSDIRSLLQETTHCVAHRIIHPLFAASFAPSALPLLSPEQEILSNGIKMCRERLVPLRRRKSDVVGGGVRARASSNSSGSTGAPTSAGSESSLSKRRSSTSALRSSDMSRPSTTNSVNTARERGSSGRISRSSESGTGLAADQGHLKVSSGKHSRSWKVNLTI